MPAAAPAVIHAVGTDRHEQAAQIALSAAAEKAETGVHCHQTAAVAAPAQAHAPAKQKRPLSPSSRCLDEPPADPRVHLAAELPQRAAALPAQQPVCLTGLHLCEDAATAVACASDVTSPAPTAGVVAVAVDPSSAIFAPQQLIDARCFALPQVRMNEGRLEERSFLPFFEWMIQPASLIVYHGL